jgi:hypothetical protein
MSHIKMHSRNSPIKGFHLELKPAPAWTAILGFSLISLLGILGGAGSILRLIFPLGAFVVGVFLYRRYPLLYLGFTWWLWFLTAWVRRLIDLRSGFVDPSPVLLAPFFASIVTLATLFRLLPKLYAKDALPYVLALFGVTYSILIGLINSRYGLDKSILEVLSAEGLSYSPTSVILKALDWGTPILFSFHIAANWRYYPEYRQNIQRVFRWGVLIMGVYGVVQYVVAPPWDRLWLASIFDGTFVFGRPEPFGFRVFGTMHSAGPYAHTMMAALLLLLADHGILRFFSAGPAFLAFLLTLVRASWGGWLLGFAIFMNSLKPKLQMRLFVSVLVIGILAMPLTAIEPFSQVINSRVQSLTNVNEDVSFQERSQSYNRALSIVPFKPMGNGLGLPGLDSAFLDVMIAMGWIGGIPFFGGLFLLLLNAVQCMKRRSDAFLSACCAISIASVGMLILNNVFTGAQGILLWSFLGIVAAGHRYYQHQENISRLTIEEFRAGENSSFPSNLKN